MPGSVTESPGLIWLAMEDYAEKAVFGWHYKIMLSPTAIAYSQLFGGDGYIVAGFYILFSLDLVTGLAAALKNRCFRFRRLDLWVVKLLTYSLCILIVGIINGAAVRSWGFNPHILDTVLTFLIASEARSIFENLSELGCPVPPVLLKLAAGVKGRAGKKLDAFLDDEEREEGEE